jgi:hypothetical protein
MVDGERPRVTHVQSPAIGEGGTRGKVSCSFSVAQQKGESYCCAQDWSKPLPPSVLSKPKCIHGTNG